MSKRLEYDSEEAEIYRLKHQAHIHRLQAKILKERIADLRAKIRLRKSQSNG